MRRLVSRCAARITTGAAAAAFLLAGSVPGQAQVPTSGLVAHWTVDNTANDSSGNGFHGTLVGGTYGTGKISSAADLDGTGDHIATGIVPDLSPLKPSSAFTISAWVKYSTTGPSGGDVANMGDSYGLRVQPDGSVKTYFYAGSNWPSVTSAEFNTEDDAWHHIVGQYTGTKLRVYIDGGFQGEVAASGSIAYPSGRSFYIGKHGNGGANHNFNGQIDQVRVYDRALQPLEIAALTAEGPPEAGTFKVLTWNVRKCKRTSDSVKDCNRVADAIETTGADVVLLSAVQYEADAIAIRNRLGSGWKLFYAKASGGSEGQAILTTQSLPLNPDGTCPATVCDSEPVIVPGAYEPQIVAKATITIAGNALTFFAIDQDHTSASIREDQSEIARDWLAAFPEPRIGGGDFNDSNQSAGGLVKWLAVYDEDWDGATRKVGYPGNAATLGRTKSTRLDHIISSQETQVSPQQARVWDVRDLDTTCANVSVGISGAAPCSSGYIDDKGVRPSDHIPMSVIYRFN
jgi:endonuclease/exonuclease/phosphatase family metal-dependent hydrolase